MILRLAIVNEKVVNSILCLHRVPLISADNFGMVICILVLFFKKSIFFIYIGGKCVLVNTLNPRYFSPLFTFLATG